MAVGLELRRSEGKLDSLAWHARAQLFGTEQ
jgi:hypothetical protein